MRHRTLIATAILIVGVGGAAWLMFHNDTNAGAITISVSSSTAEDARFTDTSSDASAVKNMTDEAIRAYGREILKLNPQGQGLDKPVTLPPDTVLQDIIAKATATPIPVTLFTTQDVATSPTNSRNAKRAYFAAVQNILVDNFGDVASNPNAAIAQFVTSGETSELQKHVDRTTRVITALRALTVPSDLSSLHLTMLNLWQRRFIYTKTILSGGDDQLQMIAALNQLADLNTDDMRFAIAFRNYEQTLK